MATNGGTEQVYAGRTIATVAAVFSVAATVLSGLSAWSSDRAKEQAERTQLALDESKAVKDYQIRVFEMIDKSLSGEQGSLVLASAYISSLDDQKIQDALLKAIRVVAEARQRSNKLTPEEADALQLLKADTRAAEVAQIAAAQDTPAATQAAAAVVNPLSENGVDSAKVNQSDVNPIGWDVDVFWCASGGEASKSLASNVAKELASRADSRVALSGAYLGRIRIRQLTDAAADQGKLPKQANAILADVGEESLGDALAAVASAKTGKIFARQPSGSRSQWYLSVFACGT